MGRTPDPRRVVEAGRGLVLVVCLLLVAAPAVHAAPSWLPAQTLSPADGYGYEPDVAIDANGTITAVWTGPSGVETSTRAPGGTWPAAQALGQGHNARIAVSDGGEAIAAWMDSSVSG